MGWLQHWRRWIRPLLLLVYVCMLVVALPLMIIEFQRNQTDIKVQGWFIGGMFVLLTLPISLWGILQHLIHYTQPHLQRHIIRILWMVPIYAVNAWIAMRFESAAIYLDSARECYEAYVIYNFMSYLLNYLRSEYPSLEAHLALKPQARFPPPLCWVLPWPMGAPLVERCKHGVMQYTVVRVLTTCIAFICSMSGRTYYGEGVFNFKSAWSYLVIINNFSQIFSMFCLVTFYKATKEELGPIKPIAKFMCVKAVVFMSFWQAVLIAILFNVSVIPSLEAGIAIQDFCICIEMLIAAVAHYYSFSHKPFVDLAADPLDWRESLRSMWDVSDVHKDVVEHIQHVGETATDIITSPLQTVKSNITGRPPPGPSETEMTPLLRRAGDSDEEELLHSPPTASVSHSPDVIRQSLDNGLSSPDVIVVNARSASDNLNVDALDDFGRKGLDNFNRNASNSLNHFNALDTNSRNVLENSYAPRSGVNGCPAVLDTAALLVDLGGEDRTSVVDERVQVDVHLDQNLLSFDGEAVDSFVNDGR